MAKIMLVEDDNNLREIYGARLMAEGFEIVSAADGEEALALAVKQKPDLIVSDVMMPKISGFDMLDILRTTPETKNTKVIMMTALSQPEDRARGEALGADKYLVKSQVTLEDVVSAVHEVLGDGVPAGASASDDNDDNSMVPPVVDSADSDSAAPAPDPEPSLPEPPVEEPTAPAEPEEPSEPAPESAPEEPAVTEAPADETSEPPEAEGGPPEDPTQAPETEEEPEPTAEDDAPSHKQKIIEPINDLKAEPNIIKLAKEEEIREQQIQPGAVSATPAEAPQATAPPTPAAKADTAKVDTGMSSTMADEKKDLEQQIKEFVETSEAVNGEPPKQVEPPKEPEVGDPEYQPPIAENDVVEIGEPPSDEGIEVPKAAEASPPPPAEPPAEDVDALPDPPSEAPAEPVPVPEPAPSPAETEPAPSPEPLPEPPPEPPAEPATAAPKESTPTPASPPTPPDTPIPSVASAEMSPTKSRYSKYMRLNKYLAHATGMSRREADLIIEAGRVTVNGRRAKLGVQVAKEHDLVEVDGRPVEEGIYRYLLLNKPVGYLSSRRAQSAPTLYDLIPKPFHSLKTVGRLDKDSSGLILLTDDGDFAHQLTHPKFQKEKRYLVALNRYLTARGAANFNAGVELEDGISNLKVKPHGDGRYEVILKEGRNRQIRRTFEALDYQVTELHRTSFGPYSEADLGGSMYAEVDKRT